MPYVVYRSEAENRDSLSDVRGENLVNKNYRVQMQIFIERLWGETCHRNGKYGNLARAGRERFESPH